MNDSVVRLSHFRADVARSLARRGKSLLVAADVRQRVQALEPLEAYFVIKEVGVDDAAPLLKHVTPEQLQAFVDIDCWDDERPDPIEIDAWLAPFAAAGKLELGRALYALDSEIVILLVAASLTIHDARSETVPPPAKSVARMTTPDTYFVLDAPQADRREIHPFAIIDALYAADMEEAFRLVMAAKWELPSPLEEEARRFRNARLEELGFSSREHALRIFAPPPASPPGRDRLPSPVPATLPAVYAQPLAEGSLLERALARVDDPRLLQALESEIAYLISEAIIAYEGTPQDVVHVVDVATRVRDTVTLGLEALRAAGGAEAPLAGEQAAREAAELLQAWPARDLFRHGHRQALALQASAAALARDPVVAEWLDRIETEQDDYSGDRADREMMRALLGPQPLYAGFDRLAPERCKAFGSRAELHEAEQRIDTLAQRLL